jgi:ABC-type sugar transport system substrate-binding protein
MKKLLVFLLIVITIVTTVACSSTPGASTDVGDSDKNGDTQGNIDTDDKKVLGLVLFYRRDEFYMDLETKVKLDAEKAGFEVLVTDADTDMAKAAAAIEDYTAKGVDAIICSGSQLLVSSVEAALDKGIPVVCFDGSTPTDKIISNITYDPIDDGISVGNWAKQYIEEHWPDETVEIAILDFPESSEICVGRTNGFIDVINTIPNAKIVAQMDGKASRADSMAAAETILEANPNVKLAYGINFDTIAGFYAALEARQKTDTVLCASGSWGEEAIRFLEQDHPQYKAFTLMDPWKMGSTAVQAVVDALEGKDVEQTQAMKAVTYTSETINNLDWKEIIENRIK